MKNSRIISLFVLLCTLAGCQLATFTARPGVVVKTYPKEMYGTYRAIQKKDGVYDTLLVTINEKGTKVTNDAMINKIVDLSDTNNTLSHLGDFYYLNIRDKDSEKKPYWYVYPFEFNDKCLYVYTLTLGKAHKKLKKYLKPTGREDGEYIMDDQAFLKYCEKHLKKRKALKLERIK